MTAMTKPETNQPFRLESEPLDADSFFASFSHPCMRKPKASATENSFFPLRTLIELWSATTHE